ncbi:MAG: hypothetical protein BZY80_02030 [SAR202 cluster bacterium Io17-Chloro-G2]|nr:MAG: hypothetical protein BZY80_02030 [SAR202 cluster bacterium Io17-Chloro-G2]
MPVKRIDVLNWERLKKWAVPLDDGVDDVLKRLLDMADEHATCGPRKRLEPMEITSAVVAPKRALKGTRLPEEAFKLPILQALYEMGGVGKVSEILDLVERKVKHLFSDIDRQTLPTSTEVRWYNTAKWARKELKEDGLLKDDSPHGIWELSGAGFLAVKARENL